MKDLPVYIEDKEDVFVHAGVNPKVPLNLQTDVDLMWSFNKTLTAHVSGKRIITGHMPRTIPKVTKYFIGLDTGIANNGYLTCLELSTNQTIQADKHGMIHQDQETALVAS